MSENLKTSLPQDVGGTGAIVQSTVAGLSSRALARRQMLLKGLGKGSAVLAAATVPMHSLATTGTITNTGKGGEPAVRCGISGMMSGVHSRETFTTVCSGYSPGRYKKIENWPNYRASAVDAWNSVNGKSFHKTTKFSEVFGGGLAKGMLDIMNDDESSDEFHWIAALLNAVGGAPSSFNFPYTGSEVLAFYKGAGQYTAEKALAFFKTYMEIHP